MSVGIHLVSPGSKGLFSQAMMESDPSSMYYRTLNDMALYGEDFCSLLKCSYVDHGETRGREGLPHCRRAGHSQSRVYAA